MDVSMILITKIIAFATPRSSENILKKLPSGISFIFPIAILREAGKEACIRICLATGR